MINALVTVLPGFVPIFALLGGVDALTGVSFNKVQSDSTIGIGVKVLEIKISMYKMTWKIDPFKDLGTKKSDSF